jgi:apoptosis-inducing factor 2
MLMNFVYFCRKDYFEIPYAELRCKVEPSFAERSLIKHTDYLPDVRIINCSATGVTEKEVLTEDGGSVPYDYLVIATGHLDSAAKVRDDRLEEFRQGFWIFILVCFVTEVRSSTGIILETCMD